MTVGTEMSSDMSMQTKTEAVSFYPLALSLNGKAVLVFGGNLTAAGEVLRLVEAGASVVVANSGFVSELQELQVAYGARIELVRMPAGKFMEQNRSLKRFSLIFSFLADGELNQMISSNAFLNTVPVYCEHELKNSDFVSATVLKRGHVKVAVSTDGICPPMERALINRIEELFISDFDRYSLFVAAVEERLAADQTLLTEANQSEEFLAALTRNNFDQALKTLDLLIASNIDSASDSDSGDV